MDLRIRAVPGRLAVVQYLARASIASGLRFYVQSLWATGHGQSKIFETSPRVV